MNDEPLILYENGNVLTVKMLFEKNLKVPDVRQLCDFIVSVENYIRVTSLSINEDYVKKIIHQYVDMEAN